MTALQSRAIKQLDGNAEFKKCIVWKLYQPRTWYIILRLNPNDCLTVNPFSHKNYKSTAADNIDGITWPSFESMSNSLKSVVWMIRPQGNGPPMWFWQDIMG